MSVLAVKGSNADGSSPSALWTRFKRDRDLRNNGFRRKNPKFKRLIEEKLLLLDLELALLFVASLLKLAFPFKVEKLLLLLLLLMMLLAPNDDCEPIDRKEALFLFILYASASFKAGVDVDDLRNDEILPLLELFFKLPLLLFC